MLSKRRLIRLFLSFKNRLSKHLLCTYTYNHGGYIPTLLTTKTSFTRLVEWVIALWYFSMYFGNKLLLLSYRSQYYYIINRAGIQTPLKMSLNFIKNKIIT